MIPTVVLAIASALAGALVASILACIPGLHIYNVLGLLLWIVYRNTQTGSPLPPTILIPAFLAMIAAWSTANSIPSILLAAPDESALHTVLPGQKMLLEGKGREAVFLTAIGSLISAILLLLTAPLLPRILPLIHTVTRPHLHWILWCVILFLLLSEWPKSLPPALPPLKRFLFASKSTGVGLLVFLLSGFLGFILFFRSPLPVERAFQNLMPAFVGLFTLPWLILNGLAKRQNIPAQSQGAPLAALRFRSVSHGALAGICGGGFAAFFPVITGGIGGMLAGHATAMRDNQSFLVSQGASKALYYTGGTLLLCMPGLHLTRGGGAWLLRGVVEPSGLSAYSLALGGAAIGIATSLLLLDPLAKWVLKLATRTGFQCLSCIAATLAIALVAFFGGLPGLAVMAIATGMGLLTLFYGTRRMNALGIILLPMACSLSGIAPLVSRLLFASP